MACAALQPDSSKIALLRLLPCLFPVVFICAAVAGSISILYAAVALHLLILGAENTIGRLLANTPIAPLLRESTLFEDACLLVWPALHLSALAAVLCVTCSIWFTVCEICSIPRACSSLADWT